MCLFMLLPYVSFATFLESLRCFEVNESLLNEEISIANFKKFGFSQGQSDALMSCYCSLQLLLRTGKYKRKRFHDEMPVFLKDWASLCRHIHLVLFDLKGSESSLNRKQNTFLKHFYDFSLDQGVFQRCIT